MVKKTSFIPLRPANLCLYVDHVELPVSILDVFGDEYPLCLERVDPAITAGKAGRPGGGDGAFGSGVR